MPSAREVVVREVANFFNSVFHTDFYSVLCVTVQSKVMNTSAMLSLWHSHSLQYFKVDLIMNKCDKIIFSG